MAVCGAGAQWFWWLAVLWGGVGQWRFPARPAVAGRASLTRSLPARDSSQGRGLFAAVSQRTDCEHLAPFGDAGALGFGRRGAFRARKEGSSCLVTG